MQKKLKKWRFLSQYGFFHGLRTPREEIAFPVRPKIQSQSQIFRYGQSIFCLPHRPNFSDFFDLCLHKVSVVRGISLCNFFVRGFSAKAQNQCTYVTVHYSNSKKKGVVRTSYFLLKDKWNWGEEGTVMVVRLINTATSQSLVWPYTMFCFADKWISSTTIFWVRFMDQIVCLTSLK